MLRSLVSALVLCGTAVWLCGCKQDPAYSIVLPEVSVDEATLADLAPAHRALVGTTWTVGEYTARFLGPDRVYIAGRPLADVAPEGLEAEYTYHEGRIEISALDHVKAGTWDGERLVVDGAVGVRQQ